MNILIINCHWDNHGDEAAIRAMIDELQSEYPDSTIYIQKALGQFEKFPEYKNLKVIPVFPNLGKRRILIDLISCLTNGRLITSKRAKEFFSVLKKADIIIHAPGGPSIGDIYLPQERTKLLRLLVIRKSGKPYAFYAPSMGPFKNKIRNPFRKKVLEDASLICLREELSQKMVKEFVPKTNPIVTLDSAFQHEINYQECSDTFDKDEELKKFLSNGQYIVGMTVTDLQWNLLYHGNYHLVELIRESFKDFITYLIEDERYKILFIPQLFGKANDSDYMKTFATENCFVMNENYDCYFQQYIISKLHAVVGMRYHSNIFSAKMGTPFISISYEQKMKGFMEKAGLMNYCVDIADLSFSKLRQHFDYLEENYASYRSELMTNKEKWKREARKTTDLICQIINKKAKSVGK